MAHPVKIFRVDALPADLEPASIYYVKNGSIVTEYVTDNAGIAHVVTPPSGSELSPFVFTQVGALISWTINHNLGRNPVAVRVLSPGGIEVIASVLNVSVNQVVVSFASAQAGSVIIL